MEYKKYIEKIKKNRYSSLIVLIVILIIIFGGGYILFGKPEFKTQNIINQKKNKKIITKSSPLSSQNLINYKNSDKDDDGLTYEQEMRLGTDPTNNDTDHDGFNDGEEVARGFSPLIATSEDKNGFQLPVDGMATTTIEVDWSDSLYNLYNHFFKNGRIITSHEPRNGNEIEMFRVGTVKGGSYDGFHVITQLVQSMGVSVTKYLGKYSTSTGGYDPAYEILPAYYRPREIKPWHINIEFKDLETPETIPLYDSSNSNIGLRRDKWGIQTLRPKEKSSYLTSYKGYEVRMFEKSQCPYIVRDDFSIASYHWDVDFGQEDGTLDVKFLDGTQNEYQYEYKNFTCGGSCTLYKFADLETLDPNKDFKLAGYSSDGRAYYELKNQNHAVLLDLFNSPQSAYKYNNPDLTYEEFYASHPLLYWKDPLGRWIEFQGRQFLPAAEKCKPVIYLYPEKETEVSVRVEPKGGMIASIPSYPEKGWRVTASPDGTIVNKDDKKSYNYLFWEGIGYPSKELKEGFIVDRSNLHSFFEDKMSFIGFNKKELADFIKYWIPKLQEDPYYLIRFNTSEEINSSAPLYITPQPDTVIRMFIEYRGLREPFEVEEQILQSSERKGFVVVEWGGSAN